MTFIFKSPPFVIQGGPVSRFSGRYSAFQVSLTLYCCLLFFLCCQLRDGLAEFFAEGVEPVEQLLADAVVVCPA